jgi:hypothetical protein
MSAATPGWLFMPAPISDTFAMSGSFVKPVAPISLAVCLRIRSALTRSSFGSVNETSVWPCSETFCTIMSMFTPASESARKIRAATPGRSGTPSTVTFASEVSWMTPEMIAFSSIGSSSSPRIHVPSSPVKVERTCTETPWLRANSTERSWSTRAPLAAISSISSYVTPASLRASGTMRGSAVKTPSTSV